jgi:hypothetical protein
MVVGSMVGSGTAAFLFAAPHAVAQRDASDRGQRLDSDAFRNDMLQDRLKKPAYQNWQAAPVPEGKPKRSGRKRKSN